jgi:hypothetical protein
MTGVPQSARGPVPWQVVSSVHGQSLGTYRVAATALQVAQRTADSTGREIVVTRDGEPYRSFFPLHAR